VVGSDIGAPAAGPVAAACKPEAREEEVLNTALGRFKNARHAGELRHRGSSASLMARRYSSKPVRRSSLNVALDVVFANQDLGGRGAGGGTVTWFEMEAWNALKSE
jgi:hypothetical protein